MKLLFTLLLASASVLVAACGSDPGMDKDSIRRNADDADRDLDRETQKHRDD